MSLLRRVGLLVAGALVSSLLVALPVAPAHADYDLGVTWPDVSEINPNATDYQITVIDSGPGDLYARWDGYATKQLIPHNGSATINFPYDDTGRVEIWRCVASTCEWAGVSSPVLSVRAHLPVNFGVQPSRVTSPGMVSAPIQLYSVSGLTNLTYDWVLRDPTSAELSSGSGSLVDGSNNVSVDVPDGLADGSGYTLTATAHGDFAGGPLLDAHETFGITVDNTPPVVTVTPGQDVVFPYDDGYRDTLTIHVAADENVSYAFDLLDENNDSVGVPSLSTDSDGPTRDMWWSGRAANKPVPAGTYHFNVTATDVVGHVTSVETSPFRVDLARKKTITTTVEVPAAKVIYDRFVGKCSTLAKPSSHRWKGSVGLYSQTKCKREKNSASVVVMWSAWWLPTSMRGLPSFDFVTVEAYGGAALGQGGSYLVTGLIDSSGKFSRRQQFTPKLRWHHIATTSRLTDLETWVRYQDGRPYVVWSSGLTVGSRYDIKSFLMRARFEALVEPDGTLISAPARAGTAPPRSTRPLTLPEAIGAVR